MVIAQRQWRRSLSLLAPLALIVTLFIVYSGAFDNAASAVYGEYGCPAWDTAKYPPISSPWGAGYWVPPNPCQADPWGITFNPITGEDPPDKPFDGYITADELKNGEGTGLLDDINNKGKIHIIDVRTPQEDQDGAAPCFYLFGLPAYTLTNLGHPIWQWPDGSYEESYFAPYFIGIYSAGTSNNENGVQPPPESWVLNVRPTQNPNFIDIGYGSYMRALLNQGEIDADDTFVVMCQSGWRASYAATAIKNLPQFGNANVKVLYGGMLGWSDDHRTDDGDYVDPPYGPDPNNIPGPDARGTTQYDPSGPYEYDTNRLILDGQPVMWNGTEPHAGVKPEWFAAFGAGDFRLQLDNSNPRWASYSDYHFRVLSVDYTVRNDRPLTAAEIDAKYNAHWNYPESCGGAALPLGSCEPVLQTPHGPAYNAIIAQASADNGVTAINLPVALGDGMIEPTLTETGTVRYQLPDGVTTFNGRPTVMANDVPNPQETLFGPAFGMMFTYMYTDWQDEVTGLPSAPPVDDQLSDDLIFMGNAGGNNIKVIDVWSQSVVNTVGTGTGMNKNHGIAMDGDPRYVWTANDGVTDQKLKVVKYDLGTLTEAAAFEEYVPGYAGAGLCGIEFNRNNPDENLWALAMSSAPGQGGAWEIDPDAGFTGNYVDPGLGTENRATCGIGWSASGTTAYASLMMAKNTAEVSWPGGPPTGSKATSGPMLHILDTNKEAGLIYVAGGNSDGVGSSIEVVDMPSMTVVGRTPLEGFNPHSVTLAHDNGIMYVHSRIGAADGSGVLIVLDTGGGSAGGTLTSPTVMALIEDEGTGGSCGNDVARKSDFCAKPALNLSQEGARWASYDDYQARQLSVDYSISNGSALAAAHNLGIAGAVNSNGVSMIGATPVGNLPGGGSASVTVTYQIPEGVNTFKSTVYATAADLCNNTYTWPGPYPNS